LLCESLESLWLWDCQANALQILSISIYLESNDIPKFPFGKRATIYPGIASLSEIFLGEVLGKYIKKPEIKSTQEDVMALESEKPILDGEDVEFSNQTRTTRDGKMLVTGKPPAF
jgi:hypothetical protein